MNEQIRQLLAQSTNPPWDGEQGPMNEFNLERFAELIVKECILTIQMGITRDGHNTEKYLRSVKHIKQIKEHFGIEE